MKKISFWRKIFENLLNFYRWFVSTNKINNFLAIQLYNLKYIQKIKIFAFEIYYSLLVDVVAL